MVYNNIENVFIGDVDLNRSIRTAIMVLLIVAVSMCGIAIISNAGIGITAPEKLTLVNGDSGVDIVWSAVEDADGYIIYRKGEDGTDKIAKLSAEEGLYFCDSEAKSGEEYTYTIKAYNGMRKSRKSEGGIITYLSKPSFKYVTGGVGCIELVWNVSHGADGYNIYKITTDGLLKKIASVQGDTICAYNDTDVKEGESYEYSVVAQKGEYVSGHEYKKSGVYIEAPELSYACNTPDGIKLKWQGTDSADSYVVYRKTDGEAKWSEINTTDETSYYDEAIDSGVKYIYTVRAKDGNYYSGYDRMGVSVRYINAPDGLKVANYNNGISLSWNKVSGADKYNVYRKNGDDWQLVGVAATNRFVDTKIEDDTKYTYTVKAKNSAGDLSAYDESVECRAYTAPINLVAESTSDGIKITWAKKASATGYIVYRKSESNPKWAEVKRLDKAHNYAVDYSAQKGAEYTYTVRALKGELAGSYSEAGITIKHLPVSKLNASLSPTGIKLNWTKSAIECDEYILYKSTGKNGKWQEVKSFGADELSYVDTTPVYGDINNYKLTLKLSEGDEVDTQVASAYGVDPNKPMVALTYDDGPNTKATNRILDALEKVNGRATFFIVGERLNEFSGCIDRENALGCEIANHTYNHVMFNTADSATIKKQIKKTNDQVRDMTGKMPTLARAPGGYTGSNPKEDVGMPLIQWSVDTMDWSSRNADAVVAKIKSNVKDGDIVLMHDLYDSTAEATEQIVPWLVAEGYQIVTVSEMMAVKGITMQPGEVYFDAKG